MVIHGKNVEETFFDSYGNLSSWTTEPSETEQGCVVVTMWSKLILSFYDTK